MGLLENAGKTQLTALRPKDLEELRKAADPREVKQNLVMLGTVTVTRMKRRTAAEEAQRLEKAASTAARATFLPLSRKAKYETIRATATAQASYGWIGRKPPEAECKRLDLAAWKACGEPHEAGMHHKRLLLSLPLETEIGIRQVMRMLHASGRWRLTQAAPAASEKCAFEWLRKHGWTMTGPRVWSHQVLGFQIRPILPGRTKQRDEHAHFLRESWRAQEFALFLQDPRHATLEYATAQYSTNRLAACRKLVESATGPHRWILLGAATSPLEHAIRYSSRDDPVASCPHLGCHVAQAGWNHTLWECPRRGHVLRACDGLQRRYGWPAGLTKHPSNADRQILDAMAVIVVQIWHRRR